ncbi:MAG: pirin family protein [Nannocystaceae bacterium]|nr:pirin family protein [Myxococcales bacterium]
MSSEQGDDRRDRVEQAAPGIQRVKTRDATLGEGMMIRRALPTVHRRMIGAWCFLDHFGPVDVREGRGMRVGPHPHIGLQTFTWPVQGEIVHRDSLGYVQPIKPGQVNLMTAGRGIVHSEESPTPRPSQLHGAQLWIALPDAQRSIEPAFDHYPAVPVIDDGQARVTVLAGEALGERSPVRVYSPLVALELVTEGEARIELPLRAGFEYGAIALAGAASLADQPLAPGSLLYFGVGRERLTIVSDAGARILLLGGAPFGEEVLLWWNFVARTRAEIERAHATWAADGFGDVRGYDGERLRAPALPWATQPAS